jgi:hypothetical protein
MRIDRIMTGIGLCSVPVTLCAQSIDTVLLSEQSFTHLPFVYSVYSSLIDRNDAPYLYTAGLESGFCTYDISDATAPDQVLCLYPAVFNGLKPTNLFQQDDLLFVSLGGFQGATQNAGLAIFDVSDPENATMLDQWDSAVFATGSAIVRVQDGYAYLGAMESGLIILDVSEPSDIGFVSSFLPDTVWPGIVSYPPNARGMALKGDTLFLAYDAGGIRAIDVSNKSAPLEIGHYVNPQQPPNTADAYNNLRLVGDLCYVATDFCGFEVVDISDPANMQQVAWVNPWNCNGLSWFGSDGHTNELITAMNDSLLFLSGADSEVLIYDITTPSTPQLVGGFIHPNDSSVAWGLDVHDDLVSVNYVNNSLVIFPPQPYYADDGGFQLFTWHADLSTGFNAVRAGQDGMTVAPNPTNGIVHVRIGGPARQVAFTLRDAMGRTCLMDQVFMGPVSLDLSGLEAGLYTLLATNGDEPPQSQRIILLH